jgi:ribonuclease-3
MPATNTNTYEPLEFLGDAYLELIATRLIHERFPQHTVGQKAGLRELLIRNDTLATYSREYAFGDRVKVAGCERADTNSKAWIKILADVFEAYVACVILSDDQNGFNIAEKWLWELWEPRVRDWREKGDGKATGDQEHASSDVKSMLQKYVVAKGVKLEYLEERPMEHIKDGNRTTFFMGVYLTGWGYTKVRLGSGSGRSKQIAGAEAAKDAFVTGGTIVSACHQKKVDHERLNKKPRPGA